MTNDRIIEDSLALQMVLQRLYLANAKVRLAYREFREEFQILKQEPGRFAVRMPLTQATSWKLETGEKVGLTLEDRGMKFEGVVNIEGQGEEDGMPALFLLGPRFLRRSDESRLVDFVPDTPPKCTFINARNTLMDGQIRGFGRNGLELALNDPRQNIQEFFRIGEEATLDIALEGDTRLQAPTKVAYFGDAFVGLEFTNRMENAALNQFRNWMDGQQRLQAQRDRETFETGGAPRASHAPILPTARLMVDRDPLILLLTEREDFARRMAEGLGRKFGFASLDYIKGAVHPLLKPLGAGENNWGRFRLILVHNQLRLVSPLELTRQLIEQERCPLPVLLVGSEEDLELKRNRAVGAGAVDYFPVEPFKILSVLKKVDETLSLFA
ncbi:MAG: hypothetical protein H6Q00_386 [Holophagaceae bacterium]|nr:hypothetical protein [Holophagaceae bacterium]